MATCGSETTNYHSCSCGETFESTEALLRHAREVHGIGGF